VRVSISIWADDGLPSRSVAPPRCDSFALAQTRARARAAELVEYGRRVWSCSHL